MFVNIVLLVGSWFSRTTTHVEMAAADLKDTKKRRKPNWSQEETLLLVNIISDKRLILNGKFRPSLTHRDKREAWLAITSIVNGMNPLTQRTVEEVETKWFSLLSKSRKKIAAIRNEYNQSG